MTKYAFLSAMMFLVVIFLQVVCNRICLFNIAVPFVFIYFILRLPLSLSVNWVMTLSFLIGLVVDIFSNTYGMYAMSSTIIGGLRKPIFTLFYPREDEMSIPIPSISTLGVNTYLKYMFTLVLIFENWILTIHLPTNNGMFMEFIATFTEGVVHFINNTNIWWFYLIKYDG